MKYYYQKGFCSALQYLSLNPIEYEETENVGIYSKREMACDCVLKGKCDKKQTCDLLKEAPDKVKDNGANLRNTKL